MSTIIFLFILTSCEDKESKEKLDANPQFQSVDTLKKEQEQDFSEVKKEENIKMTDTSNGPILVQEEVIPFLTKYANEHDETKIRIKTEFGNIDIVLFKDTPLHRANFLLLTKEDYYDDTYFYRVVKGFVIQGGDSDNLSTSKKRAKIGSYLIPNEYTNNHPHVRGSFAAAKFTEQNVSNASSPFDFYIVQSKNGAPHLNGEHTVFGQVVKGMDVVDKIAQQEIGEGEWPLQNIPMDVEIID